MDVRAYEHLPEAAFCWRHGGAAPRRLVERPDPCGGKRVKQCKALLVSGGKRTQADAARAVDATCEFGCEFSFAVGIAWWTLGYNEDVELGQPCFAFFPILPATL